MLVGVADGVVVVDGGGDVVDVVGVATSAEEEEDVCAPTADKLNAALEAT